MSAPTTVTPDVTHALSCALDAHLSALQAESDPRLKGAMKVDFAALLAQAEALYPTAVTIYQVIKPSLPPTVTTCADLTIAMIDAAIDKAHATS